MSNDVLKHRHLLKRHILLLLKSLTKLILLTFASLIRILNAEYLCKTSNYEVQSRSRMFVGESVLFKKVGESKSDLQM